MTEEQWINALKAEGYSDVRAFDVPNMDPNRHTHPEKTTHVIISGTFIVLDDDGKHEYEQGARVDFPKGTTHTAYPDPARPCRMVHGVYKT